MWQKARVLKHHGAVIREFWVKAEAPALMSAIDHDGIRYLPELRYMSNLCFVEEPNQPLCVEADYIELLPEFAETVEFETWE